MPFRLKLKKSKHYNVVSKSLCVIAVKLLENATVECIVSSRTAGRECLQNVCQRLQITQPEFFGLRYQTRDGQLRWADLDRPLKKQLDKHGTAASSSLQLGVMFYVPEAQARRLLLQSDVTRYYYFSQLKSDVLEGRLPCGRREAIQLASYSLQAEFGDHRRDHHTAEYLRNFALLPKSVLLACDGDEGREAALLDEIVLAHQNLQGLDHGLAELYYILAVQRLEGYGEERFEVRDAAGAYMLLGVSVQGITARYVGSQGGDPESQSATHTARGEQPAVYRWSDIMDLMHHKRFFKIVGREPQHSAQFQLEDVSTAKYIWKMCALQHKFFLRMMDVEGGGPGGDCYVRAAVGGSGSAGDSFRWSSTPDGETGGGGGRLADVGESRESLDELGVYHTETQNSENYTLSGSTGEMADPNHNGYNHHLSLSNPSLVTDGVVAASREHIPMAYDSQQMNSAHQSYVSLPRSSESATDLRRALLPSYRQAPDYETAVLTKYGVTSCSLNDLPLETGQNNQVYNHHHQLVTSATAPNNEVDISTSRSCNPLLPPLSYMHYGNFADLTELGDSMSFGDLANNNGAAAHGRVPALMAPPLHTYSTPELTSQGLSYEVNPAQLFANMHLNYQYKPPPPYPYGQRPSASTPDLTRNHHQLRASASPDLVSRRHLSQSTIQGSEPNLPQYHAAAVNGNSVEALRSVVEPPKPVLPTYVPVGESWNAQVSGVAQPQRIQVYVSSPATREQVAPPAPAVRSEDESVPVPSPRKPVTEEKPEPSNQEASPARPLGAMMVAAMNGLTLTVAQPDQLGCDEKGTIPETSSTGSSKELRPDKVLENRLEDGQFFLEFERIAKRKPNADFTTALLSENTSRNRFSDVLPYEENRVRLTPTPDNRTGYINASHVSASVGDSQRFYIAAQGPTRETAKSFWQMVWENHAGVIVMLTETEDEHGREKCFQYWPTGDGDDSALTFGEYRVVRKGVVSSTVAVTTSLTISRSQGVACSHRNVWHLRYTDWPDHGTPGDIQGFLGFMEEVDTVRRLASGDQRLLRTRNAPTVVHCTAGVGRSGVVILCDILLFCLDHNVPVDVPLVLSSVRMQRMLSVQTLAQYKFVYQVLIRYLRNSRLI